jgi:hypothetical protein
VTSPTIDIRNRDGERITDLKDWKKLALPRRGRWKGTTPYEFADSWLTGGGPGALRLVLDGAEATSGFEIEQGTAAAKTRFDEFGGPSHQDLLLVGEARGGRTVVAVEGRIDEGFGPTLQGYKREFTRKVAQKQNTKAPERLRSLTTSLAGWEVADNASRLRLRYQLFTATAGALAAAVDAEADQAVFCLHELRRDSADQEAQARNEGDLRDFLHVVFGVHAKADADSWLVGPMHAQPRSDRIPSTIPLYIAKIST